MEKVIETYKIENAVFELVEKSEAIYAGKFYYVKNYDNKEAMFADLSKLEENWIATNPLDFVIEPKLPINDVAIAINFSLRNQKQHGYGYGRETLTENQPESIDILKMPTSLYIKAYINENMGLLLYKKEDISGFDIVADVFPYIWNNVMPANGLKVAENGAQDLEIYHSPIVEQKAICLYAAAMRT